MKFPRNLPSNSRKNFKDQISIWLSIIQDTQKILDSLFAITQHSGPTPIKMSKIGQAPETISSINSTSQKGLLACSLMMKG